MTRLSSEKSRRNFHRRLGAKKLTIGYFSRNSRLRLQKFKALVGTPVRVDRSISDLFLVDNALNESMLNPSILKEETSVKNIDRLEETNQQNDENFETRNDENAETRNDENDETRNDKHDEDDNPRNDDITEKEDNHPELRRSKRDHKQRIIISPDEIGECDDKNDKDYK